MSSLNWAHVEWHWSANLVVVRATIVVVLTIAITVAGVTSWVIGTTALGRARVSLCVAYLY